MKDNGNGRGEGPGTEALRATEELPARVLLAALQGRALDVPQPDKHTWARAEGGDFEEQRRVKAWQLAEGLPARVALARAVEGLSVPIPDGSALSLDEAERVLARKEERAAHRPLRVLLEEALLPHHPPQGDPSAGEAAPARRAVWGAFLQQSRGLRDAAREALAASAGEPLSSPDRLARALDLPGTAGAFGDSLTRALYEGARQAARPERDVRAFRAPRLMSGLVLQMKNPRFGWPSRMERLSRHLETVVAGCRALHRGAGAGFALGLLSPATRRGLGLARREAEEAGRSAQAVLFLRARSAVALALAGPTEGERREAVMEGLGGDPGLWTARWLAQAPWVADDSWPLEADRWLAAPRLALALRDSFDEAFAGEAEAWRVADDVRSPDMVAEDQDPRGRTDDARGEGAAGQKEAAAAEKAWAMWLSALL